MVHTFVGQTHLPLPTRSQPWLHPIGTQVPEALTLDLMIWSLSLWVPLAPSPSTNSYFPHLGHLGVRQLPTLGIALLFLWNPACLPTHPFIDPSIRPSIHPDCLVPLTGWAHPLSTWFTCHGSLYPVPTPLPATYPPMLAWGARGCVGWGSITLPTCSTVSPIPSWSHSITEPVSSPHLFVFRCDRTINILFFVLDIWG